MSYARPRLEASHVDARVVLWTLAIVTYVVGDAATTIAGVGLELGAEGNPVVAAAIDATGVWVLVPWKAVALAGFVAIYRAAPRAWSVGVPIGLATVGVLVTAWNLSVVATALGV